MQIKNYNFDEKEISMIVIDTNSDNYLWLGFKQDGTTCKLQKVSAFNPLQVYYDIDLTVNEIKKGFIYSTYLFLALDDTTLIARKYSVSNPLTTYTDFNIPAGITEVPVDIIAAASYVYLLIPGDISGTNAKILKFTVAGTYVQTINLSTVVNAVSFVLVGTDFWVVTNTSPATYIRVYPISGGNYDYTVNS